MRNSSTLVYFVNNFQKDLELNREEITEKNIEDFLTKVENESMEPSEKTIENILSFARSYEVIETKKTGYVEMILN